MEKRDLNLGDVVQIDPHADSALAGCFAQVENVHDWGAQCWVLIPRAHDAQVVHFRHDLTEQRHLAGRAYVRVAWDDLEYIGVAHWVGQP